MQPKQRLIEVGSTNVRGIEERLQTESAQGWQYVKAEPFYMLGRVSGAGRQSSHSRAGGQRRSRQNSSSQPTAAKSTHPQPFEHCVHRIGVEADLELRKQLSWHGWDVTDAAHGEEDLLAAGVERNLESFCQAPGRFNAPAQAHVAENDHLFLDRLTKQT